MEKYYKPVITLIFCFIALLRFGYTSAQTQVIQGKDSSGSSKTIVTAIGIPTEEKSLGTATQVVESDQLNTSGISNIFSELEGKVSGLTIINSAADPGAGTYINLRGITSLMGSNQPLIILDGSPIDNSINNYDPTNAGILASGANGNLTGGVQPTNRGLDINPSDIESITVLKGPAATALYGIQAASGALIITTKKGGKNHAGLGIEFNTSEQWSKVNKLPLLQNEYGQGNTEIYYGPTNSNPGRRYSWGPPMDSLYWNGNTASNALNSYAGSYDPNGEMVMKSDPTAKTPVTPYNPYSFFQTGGASDNNISFSGGSDNSGYRMSLGNLTQTGIIPLSKYVKNTFNINGSTALSKKFKVSCGVNYTNSVDNKVQQGLNYSGVMLGLMLTPPTFDNSNGYGYSNPSNTSIFELPNPRTSQRDYQGGPGYDNPYWSVNQNPFVSTLNRVYGYGQADYNLLNQAKTTVDLTYRLGGDMYLQDDKNDYDIGSNGIGGAGGEFLTDYFNSQLNSDLIATIKHTFSNDFKATVILGQNYFNLDNDINFTEGTGFLVPHFLDMSNATSYQSFESEAGERTTAYYGEAVLDYRSQLYSTLTARDETSSTLPVNNDVFLYPSASLAWVFTKTPSKIFPYGKLRIAFTEVGKDAPMEGLQTYYHSASIADGFTSGINFPFNGNPGFEQSNAASVMGNGSLIPEQTNSFEAGTDLVFFDNRISLSLTYYAENTVNGIFSVPVSYPSGWGAQINNYALITNQGEEITLTLTPVKQKNGFQWNLWFNWSHNANDVVSLSPGVNQLFIAGFQGGAIEALPGEPFGVIYGTDYVKTSNGALVIDDNPGDPGYGMPIPGKASVNLGNIQPKWIGGMSNAFSYKNFSLGIMVTTRQGGDIWDGTLGAMEYFGTAQQTENRYYPVTFGGVLGHLNLQQQIVHNTPSGVAQGAGGSADIQTAYSQYYWQNIGSGFTGPTSADVFDGSYIRISQINFSYKLPDKFIKKPHFTSVTITFFTNNPILWTKYPGVDPETSLTGPANGQGIDYFNNPGTKSYGVRLNLGI